MTNTTWKLVLLALTAMIFSQAQAGLFDDRYPSPRLMAMGGSGVAVNSGVWSSYYNPAALGQAENMMIGSSYMSLFNQNFFNNFFGAGVYPLPQKYGALSASFQYFGVDYEGESLSGEYTFALSHGFYLLKDINSSLAFGYSLKGYYWTLGQSVGGLELGSATTFGIDIGFQASVYSRTFVGVYFLNLNAPQLGNETLHDLPQRIVAGVAYQPYDGVTTTLDINRSLDAAQNEIWAGAEFRVFDMLDLRFGGTTNPNRFTAGLGININRINIDYALRTHSDLGETHAFGVSYGF